MLLIGLGLVDRLNRACRTIHVVWVAGSFIGTVSHVLELVAGGVQTYGEFPPALRMFWISLTLLDPLAALLLLLKRRTGIAPGLTIIHSDIAVNWTVFLTALECAFR